jgi:hypothetical protein
MFLALHLIRTNSPCMKKALLLLWFIMCCMLAFAQNVAMNIGGNSPVASALLDLSNNQQNGSLGFLGTYVSLSSNTDNTTITSPDNGLMVYNTSINGTAPNTVFRGYYCWNGAYWIPVSARHVIYGESFTLNSTHTASMSAHGSAGDTYPFGFGIGTSTGYGINSTTFLPSYTLNYGEVSSLGAGEYFAFNTDTLYNLTFNGWVYNSGNTASTVTLYMVKYSLGTASVDGANALTGTLLASSTVSITTGTKVYPFTIYYTSANDLPLVAGDAIACFIVNNTGSAQNYYIGGQLQFETNTH